MTTEVTVIVPMFLYGVRQVAFEQASQIIQKENVGEEGDTIEAESVRITKDSDGWPMQHWRVRLVKHN